MCESIAPALALALPEKQRCPSSEREIRSPKDLEDAAPVTMAARLLPVLMEAAAPAA
jgi:hypothetical protein